MDSNKQAILSALIYSDLFSFPLTVHEIWRYAGAGGRSMDRDVCALVLRSLSDLVTERNGYFCLRGREHLIPQRILSKKEARRKHSIADKTAHLLSHIPTVRFIGLSGGVAAGSARPGDDIDFFIITKHRTMYITRFFVLLLLQFTGRRRKRTEQHERDTICSNFFLDEYALTFPISRQDLYTSREIAQLTPLFDRNNTYRRFWKENQWLEEFLPHARPKHILRKESRQNRFSRALERLMVFPLWDILFKYWQLLLIKRHRTTETVTNQMLAFHPRDYRMDTLRQFHDRLHQFETTVRKRSQPQSDYLDKAENIFYTA